MHNAYIEIDKQQFVKNLESISLWVNKSSTRNESIKLCLPVKANAYGHGLVPMAQIAENYVDYLAVACLDEGVILRQNGIRKPILVFGSFSRPQVYDFLVNDLEVTISSFNEALLLIDICVEFGLSCKVHIKIDTGMHRVGISATEIFKLIDFVNKYSCLILVGVYSHLASSDKPNDSYTYSQIKIFTQIAKRIKAIHSKIICHLANSGGVCYYPDSYFDMVRPGIFSYGYSPGNVVLSSWLDSVKPCFSLKAQIVYAKVMEAGSAISYNQRYITTDKTVIVILPIGYGDGYRRMLTNCGEVLIQGQKYTVSGTICMDMLMVDVGLSNVSYIGQEAVLIGRQMDNEITLLSVANKCSTVTYEVLCGFTERLPRKYN